MYTVMVINGNKAKKVKDYKKIVRAHSLVMQLQAQGQRAYYIERESKR